MTQQSPKSPSTDSDLASGRSKRTWTSLQSSDGSNYETFFENRVLEGAEKRPRLDLSSEAGSHWLLKTCFICNLKFREPAQLENHLVLEHLDFSCHRCPKTFTRSEDLEDHIEASHSVNGLRELEPSCDTSNNNEPCSEDLALSPSCDLEALRKPLSTSLKVSSAAPSGEPDSDSNLSPKHSTRSKTLQKTASISAASFESDEDQPLAFLKRLRKAKNTRFPNGKQSTNKKLAKQNLRLQLLALS